MTKAIQHQGTIQPHPIALSPGGNIVIRFARKKSDLDRDQTAENAFTSEGGHPGSQDLRDESLPNANHEALRSSRLIDKMARRCARGVVCMMSALRASGSRSAGKSASPSEP
jgi:hypothetical protein